MAARTKTCEICQTRPAQTKAAALRDFGTEFPYCFPCHKLAEDENVHSDYGHDADSTEIVEENSPVSQDKRVQGCWICFPELDQTRDDYTARTGTSRQGMVITVPIRATAKDKARVAADKIGTTDGRIATAKSGITTLRSKTLKLELRWDVAGRFVGGEIDGKAVRNVSEAIRQTR